jgi:radical SAM enzyme (rSAM/lipoprotein system)
MDFTEKISLRKKIALSLHAGYTKNLAKIHELNYLFWECTQRCNLKCIHCGSDCLSNSSQADMPLKDFLKVLDCISNKVNPNKTMIALTGGEPLMRKDVFECGSEITKRGFPWGMVTNGYFLDEAAMQNLLNSGICSITISLDGLEGTHNWLRQNENSYKKVINATSLVVNSSIQTYDVVTCVNQKNINELNQIYDLLKSLSVRNWRLFTIFPKGRAKENSELSPDKSLLVKLFDFIKEKRKNNAGLDIYFGCEGFLGNYEQKVRDLFFYCAAGINICSILNDGSISACPSLRTDYIQGNIYQDDLWSIWENKYQIMRMRKWTKTGICETCSSYKWCNGNGLHLRDEKTGELLYCAYNTMNN